MKDFLPRDWRDKAHQWAEDRDTSAPHAAMGARAARRRLAAVTAERDEYRDEALSLAIELHHRQGGAHGR